MMYETPTPVFLFDKDSDEVLAHGPIEQVESTIEGLKTSYVKYELNPNQLQLLPFNFVNTDLTTIARMLDNKKALGVWIAENNVAQTFH